jgi:hypothetical protein
MHAITRHRLFIAAVLLRRGIARRPNITGCEPPRIAGVCGRRGGAGAGLIGESALPYSFNRGRHMRLEMRSFVMACIAAIVVAAIGALALSYFQEPVSVAFATEGARI